MNREDIIATLRLNEAALRARGVAHAAMFGSRALGKNHPDSDIDILIEIAPDAPVARRFAILSASLPMPWRAHPTRTCR